MKLDGAVLDELMKDFKEDVASFMDPVVNGICDLSSAGTKLLGEPIDELEKAFDKYSKQVERDTKKALKATIKDRIVEITKGIDIMLINFVRILCFLNKMPCRFRNLFESFDNLFQGVAEEFIVIGQAIEMGFESVSDLVYYFGVFIGSYMNCGANLLKNSITCIPFYLEVLLDLFSIYLFKLYYGLLKHFYLLIYTQLKKEFGKV